MAKFAQFEEDDDGFPVSTASPVSDAKTRAKSMEDDEEKLLRYCLTNPRMLELCIANRVDPEFFGMTEELPQGEICYRRELYKLAIKYYHETDGKLLTQEVLERRMMSAKLSDKRKAKFTILWDRIEEWAPYNDNTAPDMLANFKQKAALNYINAMIAEEERNFINGVTLLEDTLDAREIHTQRCREILEMNPNKVEIINYTKCADYFKQEYAQYERNRHRVVMTGLPTFDRATGGLFPGKVTTIIAGSSQGKSIQMLNWGHYAYTQGKNVLCINFEMDLWQSVGRQIALDAGVNPLRIKKCELTDDEFALIDQTLSQERENYFIHACGSSDATPEWIEQKLREVKNRYGTPDLVIVDNLGDMTTRNTRIQDTSWQRQGNAFAEIVKLAMKYDVPIVTAQQTNRLAITENRKLKAEGKAQQLFQDAISGDQRVVHLSHYVIGMETDKTTNVVTYHPVKMRDAQFEPFQSSFDPITNRITEIEPAAESTESDLALSAPEEELDWSVNTADTSEGGNW